MEQESKRTEIIGIAEELQRNVKELRESARRLRTMYDRHLKNSEQRRRKMSECIGGMIREIDNIRKER